MPCYTQRTTQLEAPAANLHLMAEALKALGCEVMNIDEARRRIIVQAGSAYGAWQDGVLVMTGASRLKFDENALRREYSKQVIVSTAKRQGWQIRFKKDEIEATRRRFA